MAERQKAGKCGGPDCGHTCACEVAVVFNPAFGSTSYEHMCIEVQLADCSFYVIELRGTKTYPPKYRIATGDVAGARRIDFFGIEPGKDKVGMFVVPCIKCNTGGKRVVVSTDCEVAKKVLECGPSVAKRTDPETGRAPAYMLRTRNSNSFASDVLRCAGCEVPQSKGAVGQGNSWK